MSAREKEMLKARENQLASAARQQKVSLEWLEKKPKETEKEAVDAAVRLLVEKVRSGAEVDMFDAQMAFKEQQRLVKKPRQSSEPLPARAVPIVSAFRVASSNKRKGDDRDDRLPV